MKRGLLWILMSLGLFLATALEAAETDLPILAFEKFMKMVVNSDEMDPMVGPATIMPYLCEETRVKFNSSTRAYITQRFKQWQVQFANFDPLYATVVRSGRRAEVTIEGIDQVIRSEAKMLVIMFWEDQDWKVKDWDMDRKEKALLSEVHDWKVGVDEHIIKAILTGASDKHVELVTVKLEKVLIPMSQISREDVIYVKMMKENLNERLDAARLRLEKKAVEAGQDDQMKGIKLFIFDHTIQNSRK